jgi:hypothetical protein
VQHRLALFTSDCSGERCGSKNHYDYHTSKSGSINDPTLTAVNDIANDYDQNERTITQIALSGIEL